MRSIYIINSDNRSMQYGIGTYTQQLTKAVKTIFRQIYVVTLFSADTKEITYKVEEGIQIIKFPSPGDKNRVSKDWERYLKNAFFSLMPYISKEDDLFFHFNFMNMKEFGILLKRHFECRIILTVHYMLWSFEFFGDVKKLEKALSCPSDLREQNVKEIFEEELYCMKEMADHLIAIANHSFQTMCNYYNISPQKIKIVPNGLKDSYKVISKQEKNRLRNKYHIREDEKILIFAGRLDPVKGTDYLIEAFRYMLESESSLRLFIVGEGDYQPPLMKKTAPYWAKVSFTGYIPQTELFELYRIADVGICPSLHEEFGYVALEMMMIGLPVIVNESTGLKELIDDGVNGSFVHLKTDCSLKKEGLMCFAKETLRMINDEELRTQYILNARKKYLQLYSLDVFMVNMQKFYLEICN